MFLLYNKTRGFLNRKEFGSISKKYKKIVIDIDCTVTNLQPTIDRMAEVFNLPKIAIEDVTSFTLASAFGVTREIELDFWHTYEQELCLTAEYAKERLEAILERYTDKETLIYYITSRDAKYFDATNAWLKRHELDYQELICVGKTSKVQLFEKMGIDAVFEDNPDFFYELWDEGLFSVMDTFCIDYPYNQHIPCKVRLARDNAAEIPVGTILSDTVHFSEKEKAERKGVSE